jgi:hypothetical protein
MLSSSKAPRRLIRLCGSRLRRPAWKQQINPKARLLPLAKIGLALSLVGLGAFSIASEQGSSPAITSSSRRASSRCGAAPLIGLAGQKSPAASPLAGRGNRINNHRESWNGFAPRSRSSYALPASDRHRSCNQGRAAKSRARAAQSAIFHCVAPTLMRAPIATAPCLRRIINSRADTTAPISVI